MGMTAKEFVGKFPDEAKEKPYVSNLIDRACTNCGHRGRFIVEMTIDGELTDGGADAARGGINWEYDNNSPARCPHCDTCGIWETFLIEGLDELLGGEPQHDDQTKPDDSVPGESSASFAGHD